MYVMEYLIYHLKPYGRGWRTEPPGPELAQYIANDDQLIAEQQPKSDNTSSPEILPSATSINVTNDTRKLNSTSVEQNIVAKDPKR
jgi:hypothetical protein